MYDQLGSLYSDQPDYSDPEIAKKYLTYEYFLDEVDEVRAKLGLDSDYIANLPTVSATFMRWIPFFLHSGSSFRSDGFIHPL